MTHSELGQPTETFFIDTDARGAIEEATGLMFEELEEYGESYVSILAYPCGCYLWKTNNYVWKTNSFIYCADIGNNETFGTLEQCEKVLAEFARDEGLI